MSDIPEKYDSQFYDVESQSYHQDANEIPSMQRNENRRMVTFRCRIGKYLLILFIAIGVMILCIDIVLSTTNTKIMSVSRNVLSGSRFADPTDLSNAVGSYTNSLDKRQEADDVAINTFEPLPNGAWINYYHVIEQNITMDRMVYKAIGAANFQNGMLIPEGPNQHCDDSKTYCVPWMFSRVSDTADQAVAFRKNWIQNQGMQADKSVVLEINLFAYNQYAQKNGLKTLAIGQIYRSRHIIVEDEPLKNYPGQDTPIDDNIKGKYVSNFYIPQESGAISHFTLDNQRIAEATQRQVGDYFEFDFRTMYNPAEGDTVIQRQPIVSPQVTTNGLCPVDKRWCNDQCDNAECWGLFAKWCVPRDIVEKKGLAAYGMTVIHSPTLN